MKKKLVALVVVLALVPATTEAQKSAQFEELKDIIRDSGADPQNVFLAWTGFIQNTLNQGDPFILEVTKFLLFLKCLNNFFLSGADRDMAHSILNNLDFEYRMDTSQEPTTTREVAPIEPPANNCTVDIGVISSDNIRRERGASGEIVAQGGSTQIMLQAIPGPDQEPPGTFRWFGGDGEPIENLLADESLASVVPGDCPSQTRIGVQFTTADEQQTREDYISMSCRP